MSLQSPYPHLSRITVPAELAWLKLYVSAGKLPDSRSAEAEDCGTPKLPEVAASGEGWPAKEPQSNCGRLEVLIWTHEFLFMPSNPEFVPLTWTLMKLQRLGWLSEIGFRV